VSDVARAVELALRWPGPGAVTLNVGTGRNHSVLDMVDAAAKNAAALHENGPGFTNFTPAVTQQNAHPADVPETRLIPCGRRDGAWLAAPDALPGRAIFGREKSVKLKMAPFIGFGWGWGDPRTLSPS
jgi:nucleoside-diphosphate-sugar epimerase